MLNIRFAAAAIRTPDGLVHVQNIIGGMLGQHHVHAEQPFQEWAKDCPGELHIGPGECSCGLGAGWVRDHDGHTWFNARFV